MGPSPLVNGSLVSCSNAKQTNGRENESVFPEPVNAIPIISRPDSIRGMPWIWIGVGLTMFFLSKYLISADGNFISKIRSPRKYL
jgi:hypothetical protein